jgi:hypothetical protein
MTPDESYFSLAKHNIDARQQAARERLAQRNRRKWINRARKLLIAFDIVAIIGFASLGVILAMTVIVGAK